jgi:hypothetical protein
VLCFALFCFVVQNDHNQDGDESDDPDSEDQINGSKSPEAQSPDANSIDKRNGHRFDIDHPYRNGSRLVAMANNGWIMGAVDPQHDFAGPSSNVYFRRELVVWGDCVKLRYGSSPTGDSSWLWNHMRQYVRMMSSMLDGLRIDNCHSTPLHVGQWLLDDARTTNPNLIVLAELFTSSMDYDNVFVRVSLITPEFLFLDSSITLCVYKNSHNF